MVGPSATVCYVHDTVVIVIRDDGTATNANALVHDLLESTATQGNSPHAGNVLPTVLPKRSAVVYHNKWNGHRVVQPVRRLRRADGNSKLRGKARLRYPVGVD